MQNFARNSALAKILGLAKMHNFAKIAKCHSEMHWDPAATVPLATVPAASLPFSSCFIFLLFSSLLSF